MSLLNYANKRKVRAGTKAGDVMLVVINELFVEKSFDCAELIGRVLK